ncbi:hypothetical protein SAMN04487996_12230 [Dyadobacter soli]|uniref:Uncharacterized protein n=1 Tax=Dyadobacter soli TaxID=659014 RepID=A0A1G7WFQ5_9BACT|nr:hypothetical protein SAMN04487996_12230 [Dyadobacter soli]
MPLIDYFDTRLWRKGGFAPIRRPVVVSISSVVSANLFICFDLTDQVLGICPGMQLYNYCPYKANEDNSH